MIPILDFRGSAQDVDVIIHGTIESTLFERQVQALGFGFGEHARRRSNRRLGFPLGGAGFLIREVLVIYARQQFDRALIIGVVDVDNLRQIPLVHARAHAHPRILLDDGHLLLRHADGIHHLVDRNQTNRLAMVHVSHALQCLTNVILALGLDVDVPLEMILRDGG